MISKNKIKYIHSLENKKGRDSQGMFVAEGPKVVADILALHKEKLRMLVGTKEWLDNNMKLIPKNAGCEIVEVTNEELSKTSLLCHPQQVLAVFEKLNSQIDINDIAKKLTLVTDGVQDPGNLGTILRTAEGAGVDGVILSKESVDIYNPKTIRSTMGSVYRLPFLYVDSIEAILPVLKKHHVHTYAAHLKGKNSYEQENYCGGTAFFIGNEGNGLTDHLSSQADTLIRIPMEGKLESLNAAVASAILMYESYRQRRNA